MKLIIAQQAPRRCRGSVLILVLFGVTGTSYCPGQRSEVCTRSSGTHFPFSGKYGSVAEVFEFPDKYASFSPIFGQVVFADAESVIRTFKRMINQGWRNGGRSICKMLGCDYEYIKTELYENPPAFISFRALCLQMDRLEVDISNQLGGELTDGQKELRYIILKKAATQLQQQLGMQLEVPDMYLPPSMANNLVDKLLPSVQWVGGPQKGVPGGGETVAPSGRPDDDMRQRLNSLRDSVQLPTLEDFDRKARHRLVELQKQHAMQTLKLKDMSIQKLQLLTETHEQETARLLKELQETQGAELTVVRGELDEHRRVFTQALEAFSVAGKLLTQSKTYMEKLHAAVQQMAMYFTHLLSVETKMAKLQNALQQETPAKFQYSCLRAAAQGEATATQVMSQVLAVYKESSTMAEQVQKALKEAEAAVQIPAIDSTQLGQQKKVFKDRLDQFRGAAYNLIARMEETVQAAEERKLITIFIGEELRKQVLNVIQDHVERWKNQLTQLQTQTDHVEDSYKDFLQKSAGLGRRILATVNEVLQSPGRDLFAGISEEIAEVEELGKRIREELSSLLSSVAIVEQDILSMSENLRAANIPIKILEELGVPSLLEALQSEREVKERSQKMFQAVMAGIGSNDNTLRIFQALQRETLHMRSPGNREALDSEIRAIMAKLRDINHRKAQAEVELQHLNVDIEQLRNSMHQISQRLNLERKSAHLAGDIRGWMGTGGEHDAGTEKTAAAVSALEEELKIATETLKEKQQQLGHKHAERTELLNQTKKLEADVQSLQRLLAEEQTRIVRVTQLSQAIMDSLQSEDSTHQVSVAKRSQPV